MEQLKATGLSSISMRVGSPFKPLLGLRDPNKPLRIATLRDGA